MFESEQGQKTEAAKVGCWMSGELSADAAQSSDDGLHISDEVDGIDGMGLSNFHKNPAMAQSRLSVLYIGAGGRPPIFIFVCGGETPRTRGIEPTRLSPTPRHSSV